MKSTVDERGVFVRHTDSIGYTLVRNGKPFRVRGASGAGYAEQLAAYGGNTLRVYHPDSLAWILDEAERLGLAVAADLPLPPFQWLDPDPVGQLKASRSEVETIVTRYRDHPALLYWTLGNEVFGAGYTDEYLEAYNELAEYVGELDPFHPVSTAIIPHQLLDLKMGFHQVDVDFISLNIFGNLSNFHRNKRLFSLIWNGPYLFSEWGSNGHWEVERTLWQAPIEPTSTSKADQIRRHYQDKIAAVEDGRLLGDLVFYWGQKHEKTPTWFGFFGRDGEISEMAHTTKNLWLGKDEAFPGPRIDYLLLDGRGAPSSILLPAAQQVTVRSVLLSPLDDKAWVQWSIRREDWQNQTKLNAEGPPLAGALISSTRSEAVFTTPDIPGPYRLYYQITDADGYFATANVPFYVLNPDHAE